MTNLHESAAQILTGKDHAQVVIERMQAAQVLRNAIEGDAQTRIIGQQAAPGHWMERQVELLRRERLAPPDTNQQQGEQ